MTKHNTRRVLETGYALLLVLAIAIAGFVVVQGSKAGASKVEYVCSSAPYPACGCSDGYPGEDGYPGYPGSPEDCSQFLPVITLPYPGQ